MKKYNIWALGIVLLGIIIILIPWYIFPVCGVGQYAPPAGTPVKMHGGCSNTLKAATVLGVLAVFTGLFALALRQHTARLAAVVSTAAIGILLILFPTVITGVCRVPTMPCVFGTRPALISAGIVMIAAAIIGGLLNRNKR